MFLQNIFFYYALNPNTSGTKVILSSSIGAQESLHQTYFGLTKDLSSYIDQPGKDCHHYKLLAQVYRVHQNFDLFFERS